jgi:SAM-dependent methyltransferase
VNYDAALSTLKTSFAGGGEGDFYIARLRKLHGMQIDWLDIGIGKGARSIQPFVDCLVAGGNTLRVIGIDPDAAQPSRDVTAVSSIDITNDRFESYIPDRLFDVINADQCLYYMDDLDLQLRRIAGALKPGGCFFATCWSEDCVLYRLHTSMFEDRSDTLTGERLIARLEQLELFDSIEAERFEATVDLASWRKSQERLCAAVHVIARAELDADSARGLTRSLEIALADWGDAEPRVNIALAARKKP